MTKLKKRVFSFASILILSYTTIVVITYYNRVGSDFGLRYHEAQCVEAGINPYDVFAKKIVYPPYIPIATGGIGKEVHTYTPWGYTYVMPFTLVSLSMASKFFWGINVLALILIFYEGWRYSLRFNLSPIIAFFVGSLATTIGFTTKIVFHSQNYSLLIAALVLLMLRAIENKHQVLAGFCWALIMTKPQLGLLFSIPLLFSRQWIVIGVAIITCLIASIPPMILCHASLVDLILQLKTAGEPMIKYWSGSFLINRSFVPYFGGALQTNTISMLCGIMLCLWFSFKVKNASFLLIRFIPAIICSLAWSYIHAYDRCLVSIPLIAIGVHYFSEASQKLKVFDLCGILLLNSYRLVGWSPTYGIGLKIMCFYNISSISSFATILGLSLSIATYALNFSMVVFLLSWAVLVSKEKIWMETSELGGGNQK